MTDNSRIAGLGEVSFAYATARTNEFSGMERHIGDKKSSAHAPLRAYHVHVYFDADQAETAAELCRDLAQKFSLHMGRVWSEPVGPHPRGSCQLTVPLKKFGDVISWLVANHGQFTVFVHGLSGNDIADHTLHTLWLGAVSLTATRLRLAQYAPTQVLFRPRGGVVRLTAPY